MFFWSHASGYISSCEHISTRFQTFPIVFGFGVNRDVNFGFQTFPISLDPLTSYLSRISTLDDDIYKPVLITKSKAGQVRQARPSISLANRHGLAEVKISGQEAARPCMRMQAHMPIEWLETTLASLSSSLHAISNALSSSPIGTGGAPGAGAGQGRPRPALAARGTGWRRRVRAQWNDGCSPTSIDQETEGKIHGWSNTHKLLERDGAPWLDWNWRLPLPSGYIDRPGASRRAWSIGCHVG
jgi:hypothetical protein